LGIVVDARDIWITASLLRDEGRLSNEERARLAGALRVVFDSKRLLNKVFIRAESCEGSEYNAMLQVQVSDFYRLEKFGGRHLTELLR
jgi:hypothetical protein